METESTARRPFQFGLRTLFALIAVAGAFFGCVAFVRGLWPDDGHGPREDRTKWSPPLTELITDAKAAQIDVEPVHVYCAHGFYVDWYYIWRMNASPGLVALMTQKWRLGPASANDIAQLWQDMPSEWEKPNAASSRRYLAAHHPQSDNFIVMIDGTSKLVYVWYWFNF